MPTATTYLSNNTSKLLNNLRDEAIVFYSKKYNVDAELIKAIIAQESNNYAFAFRYEPQLKKAKWYTKVIPHGFKGNKLAYCSMGYMQVLYGVARSYGFKGSPIELFDTDAAIHYGVKHLVVLGKRYMSIKDVISAYNQGSNRKDSKGNYRNQEYVNAVYNHWLKLSAAMDYSVE